MSNEDFARQAERCRGQALVYLGKPESLVLLRIAREFDRLASGNLDLTDAAQNSTDQKVQEALE